VADATAIWYLRGVATVHISEISYFVSSGT